MLLLYRIQGKNARKERAKSAKNLSKFECRFCALSTISTLIFWLSRFNAKKG